LIALSTISTARGFWLHEGGVNFIKTGFVVLFWKERIIGTLLFWRKLAVIIFYTLA
jgi:hypothetical protein